MVKCKIITNGGHPLLILGWSPCLFELQKKEESKHPKPTNITNN